MSPTGEIMDAMNFSSLASRIFSIAGPALFTPAAPGRAGQTPAPLTKFWTRFFRIGPAVSENIPGIASSQEPTTPPEAKAGNLPCIAARLRAWIDGAPRALVTSGRRIDSPGDSMARTEPRPGASPGTTTPVAYWGSEPIFESL